MKKSTGVQTALLIAYLVIVWGVNWPLSKYALAYMPPVLFSGIRTLLGGLLLLGVAIPRFKNLQFRRTWRIYAVSAILNVVLYYGLQTIGLGYLPSGLFSAIVFLQPVLVGLFSWLWLGESMNGLKIIGLVLGFAGVAVICSGAGGISGHISVAGILLALGSALSWALGVVFVKKSSAVVDPIWLVTLQLLIGGGFMTVLGTCVENWSDVVWSAGFIGSLFFISVFVIALGWLVFYRLIGSGEASKVASFTFLIPLVAILTGCLIFSEPFTVSLFAGLVLILLSIYFVSRQPSRQAARMVA
ncbi:MULTISPECIES: DMT family transporter [unclassified Paenibacillus]|uniref:DMT family transporter n=1 Tax=unclassified Paenibacillus TaxID=185978 RepID=UPI00277FF89E|nr:MULTISPECIES: DMT family transporter [unclassified Paenibacillus]MDQ0903471.1 drug/metabolite transporter (DMT)-like permease [Paenibacillus sp. V4I7]MDQ0918051.1 drug/metabolite transporter (DMT)-like permease [Paenibacillus sp. V4I5]